MLNVQQIDTTLVLTLDRPDAGNSLSMELAQELCEVISNVPHRTDLRSIIITGAHEKFFCTGGDVKRYSKFQSPEELQQVFDQIITLMDMIEHAPIPVIAAINGYAIGGGLELALACDMRFAAQNAELGFPQSRLGVIPGWNGTERLLRNVGKGQALRLLLSGKRVSALEALNIGLIDVLSPSGEALKDALSFCAELNLCAPQSIAAVKKVVTATLEWTPSKARAMIRDEFARLWFTQDHKEAELAFAEKRKPVFKGV